MSLILLLASAPDTVIPKNFDDFWYVSSCCAVSSLEVLGYAAASPLGGAFPFLSAAAAGGLGCLVYTGVAENLTPVPELKPRSRKKAFNGGVLGVFVGGAGILLMVLLSR